MTPWCFELRSLWIQNLPLYNTEHCYTNKQINAHILVCFLLYAKISMASYLGYLCSLLVREKNISFSLHSTHLSFCCPFTQAYHSEENNSLAALSLSVCWQSNFITSTWGCRNTLARYIYEKARMKLKDFVFHFCPILQHFAFTQCCAIILSSQLLCELYYLHAIARCGSWNTELRSLPQGDMTEYWRIWSSRHIYFTKQKIFKIVLCKEN